MTVGERDFTPEERAMGLLFKLGHSLTSRDAVERGGATIVGTGTTFGPDGMTLNGNGNLFYNVSGPSILRVGYTYVLELTFGFALNDGANHMLFDIINIGIGTSRHYLLKRDINTLYFVAANGLTIEVAYATWSAAAVVGKNIFVVSTTTGATSVWLNGVLIGSSVSAWDTTKLQPTGINLGAATRGMTRWPGTIHRFEIYGNTSTAVDEPYLRQGTLISKLDDYLVAIPGTSYYKRASDNKFVTDVLGKANIGQALMGSNGTTTAQFPTVARQAGLVRGFGFAGAQQINLGDSDALSFTNGVNDLPFSVAALIQVDSLAAALPIMSRTPTTTTGEWSIYTLSTGGATILLVDNTAAANISRTIPAGTFKAGEVCVIIGTYRGSGLVSGLSVYKNGVRVDTTNGAAGVYAGMKNTTVPATIGHGINLAKFSGSSILPHVFDFEVSPLQVRALDARLQYQARTP